MTYPVVDTAQINVISSHTLCDVIQGSSKCARTILSFSLYHTHTPVSYTHLDVYKRQDKEDARTKMTPGRSEAVEEDDWKKRTPRRD